MKTAKYYLTLFALMGVGSVYASSHTHPQLQAPDVDNSNSDATATYSPTDNSIQGHGPYAGLNLGLGEGAGSQSNFGFLWGLNGGYNFTPALGAEVGFTHLPAKSTSSASGSSYVWDAVGVLTMPLQQRWRMFGKAGFAMVDNTVQVTSDSSSKGDQFAAYLGAGVKYKITPVLDLNTEGAVTIGDSQAANTIGILLGMSYHFN